MNCSMKTMRASLHILMPMIKYARNSGVSFDDADLCKMVAVDFMLACFNSTPAQSAIEKRCYIYVAQALSDLKTHGAYKPNDFDDIKLIELESKL